jgi:hypothetical protein
MQVLALLLHMRLILYLSILVLLSCVTLDERKPLCGLSRRHRQFVESHQSV